MRAYLYFLSAWRSFTAHKLRATLTTLGVVIGIASVIAMVSIVEGINRYVTESFSAIGGNLVYVSKREWFVMGRPTRQKLLEYARRPEFTVEDAHALLTLPSVEKAYVLIWGRSRTLRRGERSFNADVTAAVGDYPQASGYSLLAGRSFDDEDTLFRRQVIILGYRTFQELFPDAAPEEAIGAFVTMEGRHFRVIGVLEKRGSFLGQDFDAVAYIPFTTGMRVFPPPRGLWRKAFGYITIALKQNPEVPLEEMIQEVEDFLRIRRGLSFQEEPNFAINTQEALLGTFRNITLGIFAAMIGIASLALLVGGIGIMNIMLVSVAERTREIGIRMAVGATRRDILLQFLVESVVLTSVGGAIGFSLGVGLAKIVEALTPLPAAVPFWSVLLALGFSTLVGLFFGVYPARRAASLDPVEALRYE